MFFARRWWLTGGWRFMSCCLTSLMDTSITCHLPRPPCCGVVWGREAAASSLETPQVGRRDCSMSCLWSVKRGNVVWDLARQGMKHSTEPNPSSSPSSTTIFLIDPFLQNTRHHVFQESHVPQCRLKAAGKGNNLKSPFPFSCTVRQIETLPAVRDVLRHGLLRISKVHTQDLAFSEDFLSLAAPSCSHVAASCCTHSQPWDWDKPSAESRFISAPQREF